MFKFSFAQAFGVHILLSQETKKLTTVTLLEISGSIDDCICFLCLDYSRIELTVLVFYA